MRSTIVASLLSLIGAPLLANPPPFPAAPEQGTERTCFQTASA